MSDTVHTPYWPRLIALVDMNAFFASIEQLDNPEYRGKPIGVTNGLTGTCIITCSYEARALGIHTVMRVKDARKISPEFTLAPANLLTRSDMPNVIAPAWKPYGHRQTIVPTVEQKKVAKQVESTLAPDSSDYLPEC